MRVVRKIRRHKQFFIRFLFLTALAVTLTVLTSHTLKAQERETSNTHRTQVVAVVNTPWEDRSQSAALRSGERPDGHYKLLSEYIYPDYSVFYAMAYEDSDLEVSGCKGVRVVFHRKQQSNDEEAPIVSQI